LDVKIYCNFFKIPVPSASVLSAAFDNTTTAMFLSELKAKKLLLPLVPPL